MNIFGDVPSADLLRVSVVIPSLNPGASILRLLATLEEQSFVFQQIVIVDQSEGRDSQAIVQQYNGPLRPFVEVVYSPPGLSRARNSGIRALRPGWEVAILPDDDVWLAGDISKSILHAVQDGAAAGSGRLTPELPDSGTRISFPDSEGVISSRNVWRTSIEACYFFTPKFLASVGLYDETLGLGAKTPWQSGEGTDLLLRGLTQGHSISYVPGYELVEGDRPPLDTEAHRRRLRKYARGTGRVYARNYSLWNCLLLLAKSIGKIFVQVPRGWKPTVDNWQIFVGRFEGLLGKTI